MEMRSGGRMKEESSGLGGSGGEKGGEEGRKGKRGRKKWGCDEGEGKGDACEGCE